MASTPGSPERRAESRAGTIIGLAVAFVTLSCVSVILRLYTRIRILRNFGSEDTAIVIAQVLSFGVSITTIYQVTLGGLGSHSEFANLGEFTAGAKGLYSNLLVYNAAQLVTKISFLLQYRRLFLQYPVLQKLCIFGIAFLVIWGVAQQFVTAFSCTPLEFIIPKWHGHCIDTFIVFNLNSIMNILTDFAIFLIPIWPVSRLQLPFKRKLYLMVVFCLGFFACVISIIRLHELYRTHGAPDILWDSSGTAYWSAIELNVGILCACLPTLRPLFQRLSRSIRGQSSNNESSEATFNLASNSSNQRRLNDIEMDYDVPKELGSPGTITSPRVIKDSSPI